MDLAPKALTELRKTVDLSQAALAGKAGISVGYIGMIELGQRCPSERVIRALAEALGVETSAITQSSETVSSESSVL